ncbi:hypothetical protein Clacol_004438 [Clathrus columnatus]|uniref:Uncharacterized protein n=1 Tax=Clathrus columnatus TaxID=1419009 RepID=A0AAV5A9G8_9AGAM|nr:hypothetical protein Clacol_004438 [Clathrus columnatus]
MNNGTVPGPSVQTVSEDITETSETYVLAFNFGLTNLTGTIRRITQVETYIAGFAYLPTLLLIGNISVILSDSIAFLVVIRQGWGLWKEKRSLRLQSSEDIVTQLLKQARTGKLIGGDITIIQNVLSVLLLCELTLDLRQRNGLNQSAIELPTLNQSFYKNPVQSIQSVFGRLRSNIIAEMGERNDNDQMDVERPGKEEQV